MEFSFVTLFASTIDNAGVDYVFSADMTIHEGWGVDGFGSRGITRVIECFVHGLRREVHRQREHWIEQCCALPSSVLASS